MLRASPATTVPPKSYSLMTLYHVTIKQKSNPHDEIGLDFTLEKLRQRIIEPYETGTPITINGKSLPPDDIERIKVVKTNLISSHALHNLRPSPIAKSLSTRRTLEIHVANSGVDVTDEFITGPSGVHSEINSPNVQDAPETMPVRVFISHSNKDEQLARLLIRLIEAALHFSNDDIRCTSVNGYRMMSGVTSDEKLRAEVHDAELLIGLITPNSLNSAYVIFELGARWGAKRPMIPLLASGTKPEHLEGPLTGINALDASDNGQVHQFVEDAASYLNISHAKPSSYVDLVNQLVKRSSKALPVVKHPLAYDDQLRLSKNAKTLLIDAAKDDEGSILKIHTLGGVVIKGGAGGFGYAIDSPREEAIWIGALRDLLSQGLVQDPKGTGGYFKVTDRGFELAVRLKGAENMIEDQH